jgi:hypothetical protein
LPIYLLDWLCLLILCWTTHWYHPCSCSLSCMTELIVLVVVQSQGVIPWSVVESNVDSVSESKKSVQRKIKSLHWRLASCRPVWGRIQDGYKCLGCDSLNWSESVWKSLTSLPNFAVFR